MPSEILELEGVLLSFFDDIGDWVTMFTEKRKNGF
jgi:hypothetical protein